MQRLTQHFDKVVWLNPVHENHWGYTHSIGLTQQLIDHKMYPLTVAGLGDAIRYLAK